SSRFLLQREKHLHYLKRGLRQLSEAYECLDASRPWLCYWILHSLELLDEPLPQSVASDVCQFLSRCQSPQGGFGGGPGQHPHLAPTYAAVSALCIIGTEEAFGVIDRSGRWRGAGVRPAGVGPGGGRMCVPPPPAYSRLSQEEAAGVPALAEAARRLLPHARRRRGGRQVGAGLRRASSRLGAAALSARPPQERLLRRLPSPAGDAALSMTRWMFDQAALQEYILLCCQCLAGGLLDKPGNGLAIAQHFGSGDLHHEVVVGGPENRLQATHPVYNIVPEKVVRAVMHFSQQPVP
ncbi:FNTB farnesyltransferase, partial [Rhynochetos jubatus]|nr:FNTB farnesyltransferase [Rhynochetos jubatus]